MIKEKEDHSDLEPKLEAIIDETRLWRVIATLGMIADAKADHIEENWQDRETAKPWRTAAKALNALYMKTEV